MTCTRITNSLSHILPGLLLRALIPYLISCLGLLLHDLIPYFISCLGLLLLRALIPYLISCLWLLPCSLIPYLLRFLGLLPCSLIPYLLRFLWLLPCSIIPHDRLPVSGTTWQYYCSPSAGLWLPPGLLVVTLRARQGFRLAMPRPTPPQLTPRLPTPMDPRSSRVSITPSTPW